MASAVEEAPAKSIGKGGYTEVDAPKAAVPEALAQGIGKGGYTDVDAPKAAVPEVCSTETATTCSATSGGVEPSMWPEHYKPIKRIKFTTIEELLDLMQPLAKVGEPIIIEGSNVINVEKWSDPAYIGGLLGDRKVLVKKSKCSKFRYYDLKKNSGKFPFLQPIEENQQTFADFKAESDRILAEGAADRMYLQETLSGHDEMADEFVSWRWELLIRVSTTCCWGLPDSNELFVGMQEAETPLHFDERENLFFQVRGRKELTVFPFTDYVSLYPFPTTHPCDRQSMVGDPRNPDVEAFPKFKDLVGWHGVLQAGDLVYLPYGWWHWLRNLDNFAMSISFWSTTPPSDLADGVPDSFSEHMLTRVRRNLESMIAQVDGPERHNETMMRLREAIKVQREEEPVLVQVRTLLSAVKMPREKQDVFLLEMIDGRFGIDWAKYV